MPHYYYHYYHSYHYSYSGRSTGSVILITKVPLVEAAVTTVTATANVPRGAALTSLSARLLSPPSLPAFLHLPSSGPPPLYSTVCTPSAFLPPPCTLWWRGRGRGEEHKSSGNLVGGGDSPLLIREAVCTSLPSPHLPVASFPRPPHHKQRLLEGRLQHEGNKGKGERNRKGGLQIAPALCLRRCVSQEV